MGSDEGKVGLVGLWPKGKADSRAVCRVQSAALQYRSFAGKEEGECHARIAGQLRKAWLRFRRTLRFRQRP